MAGGDGSGRRPLDMEEYAELRRELRALRAELTEHLHVLHSITSRMTELVVQLLRVLR